MAFTFIFWAWFAFLEDRLSFAKSIGVTTLAFWLPGYGCIICTCCCGGPFRNLTAYAVEFLKLECNTCRSCGII